ncbi:acyl-homoserine-lactone synthase [Pseudoalteromonas sp. C2R02]|uniref:acyl-homoserine-lactone synthase n=1 Tax=Pseudoalteromonas sp. C2R02 TaxID=2841565 RepID=UPI001C08C475|nr:acyl-homoserine-lactone synthase [Pseudoalteromonas sp. C2R02]MBU2971128.1 acyl-homoserine-lactone synthase [Pseudoalteromonas sp. C2R02]
MTALAKYNTEASIEERRKPNYISDSDEIWNILTLAQKVALNKLNQFGYRLAFTRASDGTYLAIAICDEMIATIDFEGEVNLSPKIKIR